MRPIFVTGYKGMLGREIAAMADALGRPWKGADLPECDITNRKQIETAIFDADPSLIIHAAAFTAVDRCEVERDLAYLVNATGTHYVCLLAQKLDIPILYLSTDYVFDGTKTEPYDEWDAANPLSVYGKSKYAGELLVRSLCPKHFIVRISWLCGHGGANFVATILKLASERDELKVVNDQHGSPTFCRDLVPELFRLTDFSAYGTSHITNRGYTTWYDFARKILELTGSKTRILPCSTDDFPRPAPRPQNSRLSPRFYENTIGNRMPTWEEGLRKYVMESA